MRRRALGLKREWRLGRPFQKGPQGRRIDGGLLQTYNLVLTRRDQPLISLSPIIECLGPLIAQDLKTPRLGLGLMDGSTSHSLLLASCKCTIHLG